jgi:hypothetical protein
LYYIDHIYGQYIHDTDDKQVLSIIVYTCGWISVNQKFYLYVLLIFTDSTIHELKYTGKDINLLTFDLCTHASHADYYNEMLD